MDVIARAQKLYDKYKKRAFKAAAKGNIESSSFYISKAAKLMYEYNFIFSDADLENLIAQIAHPFKLSIEQSHLQNESSPKRASVIDSFALSYRGLVWIYIKGLLDLGYEVQYLAPSQMESDERFQPLKNWLERHGVSIKLFPTSCLADQVRFSLDAILEHSPQHILFHGIPWDVGSLVTVSALPPQINKLLINLTDHTFWLGSDAFDTYIEFRKYGATVSEQFRHIPATKLAFLPYYPIQLLQQSPFEGLPFKKDAPFFVSGGSAYKTEGDPTFPKMVSRILNEFPDLFFLFLSERRPDWFATVHKQYPERVYFQTERDDLLEVVSLSDFYLSTYPFYGALMTQIAAAAGVIPFTLQLPGHEPSSGLLPLNHVTIDYDSCDELISEIRRVESDSEYKMLKVAEVKKAVSNPEIFSISLQRILGGDSDCFPSGSGPDINPVLLSKASLKRDSSFKTLSETCADKADLAHLSIFDIESICGLVILAQRKIKKSLHAHRR